MATNSHIKYALAKFALLGGVPLLEAHTIGITIFTSGIDTKKSVSTQSPIVTV